MRIANLDCYIHFGLRSRLHILRRLDLRHSRHYLGCTHLLDNHLYIGLGESIEKENSSYTYCLRNRLLFIFYLGENIEREKGQIRTATTTTVTCKI